MTQIANAPIMASQPQPILPNWWRGVDRSVLGAVLILMAGGVLLSFASSPNLAAKNEIHAYFYAYRHLSFSLCAALVMVIVSMMSATLVRRLAVVGFFMALIATIATLFIGSDFESGAQRWLSFKGMTVQPSEFLKPGFIVFCAWMLAASREINGPPGILISVIATCATISVLALQPDVGQSALIFFSLALLLFVLGIPAMFFAVLIGIAAAGITFAYLSLDYVRRRIDGFLSGEVEPTSQIGMMEQAILRGGLWGRGLGAGEVHTSLPDVHTDFIVAILAEEFGVFFIFFVILVYMFIFAKVLHRALNVPKLFERLALCGLIFVFTAQTFINLGVAAQLLPSKGMTLPFLSNGGSSLIALGITMGAILSFGRKEFAKTDYSF